MQSVGTWLRVAMEVMLLVMVNLSPLGVRARTASTFVLGVTLLLGLWLQRVCLRGASRGSAVPWAFAGGRQLPSSIPGKERPHAV